MAVDVDRYRFLIRDNATVFITAFDQVFTTNQLDVIHTPPGAPRANATAERFVRTARTELLDRTLIWNERQLRVLLVEYLEHYNGHRPHRGINQNSPTKIDQAAPEPVPIDQIRRRRILDGLINEYHHATRVATTRPADSSDPLRRAWPGRRPPSRTPVNASIDFPVPTTSSTTTTIDLTAASTSGHQTRWTSRHRSL
jgi:hypothetical protein